nr:immunoglobulin light chain junction region [Macaca mulatta]
CQKYFSSPFTF